MAKTINCTKLGKELADIFGIEHSTSIHITCRVGCVPKLHVTSLILDKEKIQQVRTVMARYEIKEKKQHGA